MEEQQTRMTICEVHGNSMRWLLSASFKTQLNFFDAQLARSANHWHFTLTVWIFWRKSVHTGKALPLPSSFKPVLVREFHLPANSELLARPQRAAQLAARLVAVVPFQVPARVPHLAWTQDEVILPRPCHRQNFA